MKTISACKNLHEFQAVIKDIPPPVLGKGGGRKFMVQGKEVSMNTLVHKYFSLLKKAPVSDDSHDSALFILNKLDDLNHIKMDLSPKQEKRLAFRQKWGNFFAKIKYGPAFSHKNLRADALKIYAKSYFKESEKVYPAMNQIISQVMRKKITPESGKKALLDIGNKLPDNTQLQGFLTDPKAYAKIIEKTGMSIARKRNLLEVKMFDARMEQIF